MPPMVIGPLRTIRLFSAGSREASSVLTSAARQLFFKFFVTNCALHRSLLDRRYGCLGKCA